MGITYRVDPDLGLVFTTWDGSIHAEDLRAHWISFLGDAQVLRLRRCVADIRSAQLRFTAVELHHLIRTIVTPKMDERGWRAGIVLADLVQFGVARQFGMYAWKWSQDQIFYDPGLAAAWVLHPEDAD